MTGLMAGKRGIIMGVANNRSIAWGIAKAIHAQGGEIAFTYQGEALRKRVEPLAAEIGAIVAGDCDVSDEASIEASSLTSQSPATIAPSSAASGSTRFFSASP